MTGRARIAAVLLLLSTRAAPASPLPLDVCGGDKLDALGNACRALFRSETHGSSVNDRARITAAAARRWHRADAAATARGADCTSATNAIAPAVTDLSLLVARFDQSTGGTRACRSRRLRAAGAACRALLRNAGDRLPSQHGVPSPPDPEAAQLRAGFQARWQKIRCPTSFTPDSATAALDGIVERGIGDATTLTLRELATNAGVLVGAAVEPEHIANDPQFGPTLAQEFSSLTPENKMKWDTTEPVRGQFDFTPGDALVDFAEQHGMRVRGTALFWGRLQLPDYVKAAASADDARAMLTIHISTVVQHWAGRVAEWDVVNEPLTLLGDPGTTDGLDDHVMLQKLGPGYIAEALAIAHAADPAAKLYLNDFFVEIPGQKQDRFVRLASDLLAAGAPLHGIGIESHMGFVGFPSGDVLEAAIRRFTDLGLEVELTEVDVPALTRGLSAQADSYRSIFAACLAVPGCRAVTTWGVSDRYSWLRNFGAPGEIPLLFDDDWRRKPAYFGARAGLLAR